MVNWIQPYALHVEISKSSNIEKIIGSLDNSCQLTIH